MSRAALQRDLDAAYRHLADVEAEAGRVQREMNVAQARGESAVAEVLRKDLDYQLMRQTSAREDIEAIRDALANSRTP